MDKLGMKDFVLRLFAYGKYAKKRLEELEAENELMKAQLGALNQTADIYLAHCCYSGKTSFNIKYNNEEEPCDFWWIDGECSDRNRGVDVGVVTCCICYTECCKNCAAKYNWMELTEDEMNVYGRDDHMLCPDCPNP